MRIVIIGAGSAGTSCAYEIRKQDKECDITLIEGTAHLEYSPCALPYVLEREIPSFDDIFIFTEQDYIDASITLMRERVATRIDRENRHVMIDSHGTESSIEYDTLIIATGSSPTIPPIPLEDARYHTLRTLDDAKRLDTDMNEGDRLVIIGAGLIGLEAAHAGIVRGMQVTLIEAHPHILPGMLDANMARRLTEMLGTIHLHTSTLVESIDATHAHTASGTHPYDTLLISTGLSPNTELARNAGLEVENGIVVDASLRTSDPNIYAVGDCARIAEGPVMLGSLAYQGAQVVANSILGNDDHLPPPLRASITRIGKTIIASTGITLTKAHEHGMNAKSTIIEGTTRSSYHPGTGRIIVHLIASEDLLIGAQIIGNEDVSGRINLCSLMISQRIPLQSLARLETVYNPASAPIHEPLRVAARMLLKKRG